MMYCYIHVDTELWIKKYSDFLVLISVGFAPIIKKIDAPCAVQTKVHIFLPLLFMQVTTGNKSQASI